MKITIKKDVYTLLKKKRGKFDKNRNHDPETAASEDYGQTL